MNHPQPFWERVKPQEYRSPGKNMLIIRVLVFLDAGRLPKKVGMIHCTLSKRVHIDVSVETFQEYGEMHTRIGCSEIPGSR